MEANPFIIDNDSDDDRPYNSDKPRPSSDSDSDVDESALDREFFEKDSRFLDEPAMEEGHGLDERSDPEYQGHAYASPSKRSRTRQPKMFIFGLCCILLGSAAIGILAGSAFQSSSTTYIRKGGAKHLTMDHIFNGTFSPHLENIAWVKEGESECRAQDSWLIILTAGDGIYSIRNEDGDILLRSAADNSTDRVLVTASDIRDPNSLGDDAPLPFTDWRLSADMQYLLLKTSYRKLWRHSSFGNYFVHRLADHATFPLRVSESPAKIAYAEWSPKGHHVAFVYENDLFVVNSAEIELTIAGPNAPRSTRITDDGSSHVFNGVPDWVYEEEVFQSNSALWWNPLGDTIAFLKSNEADVRDYTLQYYNPSGEAMDPQPYPENFVMKWVWEV